MLSDNNFFVGLTEDNFKSLALYKLRSKGFTELQCQNFMYLIGVCIESYKYFYNDLNKISILYELIYDIINILVN